MLYARPNETVETYLESAPTGLVGTVGYRVIKVSPEETVIARTTANIKETPAGGGIYFTTFKAPLIEGLYSIIWDTGTISPSTTASEPLQVSGSLGVGATTGENLITLEQLVIAKKDSMAEVEAEPEKKLRYEQAIRIASKAVKTFADRQFGKPLSSSEAKSYEYEGDGYIDIDDCNKVELVTFVFGELRTPITTFYWRALPQAGPPYTYLNIPRWAGIYSPEMGFTKNLDVIVRDQGWPGLFPLVEITGVWGWPEVPADVQEAVILTAVDYAEVPNPYVSEQIAGYSYATAIRTGPGQDELLPSAIPGRAQDLLMPYVRFQV